MNKFLNSKVFIFMLSSVIFTGVGVLANEMITADRVEYSEDVSVKDKMDDLYSKAKSAYTGSTTVTPSKSTQTLYTNNKRLNSDITINPIPSNYKDLSSSAYPVESALLSGYKAYNSNGELITGKISTDCVSGSHVWTQSDSTNGYKIGTFKPSYFAITGVQKNNVRWIWYYNYAISTTYFYSIKPDSGSIRTVNFSDLTSFVLGTNYLQLKWSADSWAGQTLYYLVCK